MTPATPQDVHAQRSASGWLATMAVRWAALPRPARWLLVDLLGPLLVFLGGSLWIGGATARHPASFVSNKLASLQPIDYGATVWFYDWVRRALGSGASILEPDAVCFPGGTTLGTNFPNWLDAILAAPLMAAFPFPTGYNLWLALIPVLGCLAAYAALRCLVRHRGLALLGAWLFGFNAFSYYQAVMGRPTMALLATLPLFLAAWLKATDTHGAARMGWSILAGAMASLAVWFYVLWGLLAGLLGIMVGLGRLVLPPKTSTRPGVLLAAVLAVTSATICTAPYLYQATVLQPRFPAPSAAVAGEGTEGGPPPWAQGGPGPAELRLLGPWEPELWRFTTAMVRDRLERGEGSRAPRNTDGTVGELSRHSLPLDTAWRGVVRKGDPHGLLPLAWLAPLVLLLGLVGGRRSWPWLAASLALYSLTLGPWVLVSEGLNSSPLLVGGQRLRLPLWFLAQVLPEAGSFVKPARLFPGFLLCLVVTLAVALDALRVTLAERLGPKGSGPPWQRGAWATLVALLVLVHGLALAAEVRDLDDPRSYEPHPFHLELRADPEDYAIIELPMGLGQALGGFQAIHGKRRAEDHHDALAAQRLGEPPPTDCFRDPLLRQLWDLGRTPAPAIIDGALVEQARGAGFRYLLVYLEAYPSLARQGVAYDLDLVLGSLRASMGAPAFEDDWLVVFEL